MLLTKATAPATTTPIAAPTPNATSAAFNAVKAPVSVIAPASNPKNLVIVVANILPKSANVSPSFTILNATNAPVAPVNAATHLPSISLINSVTLLINVVKLSTPDFIIPLLLIV